MKTTRITAGLAAVMLVLAFAGPASAEQVIKFTICHATSSESHPYSTIKVPEGSSSEPRLRRRPGATVRTPVTSRTCCWKAMSTARPASAGADADPDAGGNADPGPDADPGADADPDPGGNPDPDPEPSRRRLRRRLPTVSSWSGS